MTYLQHGTIRRLFPTFAAIALLAGTTGCGGVVVEPDPNPDPASKSGSPFEPPNPDDFAPPAICGETHLGIHGAIGDEPYDKAAGSVGASFSEHGYVDSMVSGGVFLLGGDSYVLGAAENVGETAWLTIPSFLPKAGTVLCDDGAPTIKTAPMSADSLIVLSSLRELGACPGVAVSGKLVSNLTSIDGDLAGAPFSVSVGSSFGGGEAQGYSLVGGGAMLRWQSQDQGGVGILLTPPTSDDPGTFYCIGAVDIEGVQLSKISRLGTCAEGKPISGELRVCTGKLP